MSIRRRQTSINLEDLLAKGPGERLALASARTPAPKLAEMLVAMANGHGGLLLLGISPAGRVTGVEDPDTEREAVQKAGILSSPPLILPLPQVLEHQGKIIGAVEVPPGLPHVYSLNGRYLVRTGTHNRLLSTSELSALLLARSEAGFEARLMPGATLADLDVEQIADYLALVEPAGSAMASVAPARWQRTLQTRGCLAEGLEGLQPTYAGILLFGRRPQQWLHNAEIVLVRFTGRQMGDEFMRHDAAGSLPAQIRQAEAFVTSNMRRGYRLRGLAREEVTEYPLPVVREAVVNAVAHRDYSVRGEGIRVLMFSDHLEIYSPGRLPGHVTLDNLVSERFSRNEAIVQVLSDLGFVEQLGYGIDRMVASMAEAGLPPPAFEETVAGFRVSLQGRGEELVSAESSQRWGNRQITPRQEQALAYVAERGSITNREFRELFPDVSDETIRRDLADLVDQGLIMKVGDRKATYYILK